MTVFFGGLFDLNGDGELDTFERAADLAAFINLVAEKDDTGNEEDADEQMLG